MLLGMTRAVATPAILALVALPVAIEAQTTRFLPRTVLKCDYSGSVRGSHHDKPYTEPAYRGSRTYAFEAFSNREHSLEGQVIVGKVPEWEKIQCVFRRPCEVSEDRIILYNEDFSQRTLSGERIPVFTNTMITINRRTGAYDFISEAWALNAAMRKRLESEEAVFGGGIEDTDPAVLHLVERRDGTCAKTADPVRVR